MKPYIVTLHYVGAETFYVNAIDEESAIDMAQDELEAMHEFDGLEIVESESHEDDEE